MLVLGIFGRTYAMLVARDDIFDCLIRCKTVMTGSKAVVQHLVAYQTSKAVLYPYDNR